MRGDKITSVPAELEQARQRLEDWRKTQTGRARIPENLWVVAVEAARQHGVHQTSRTLRLDYTKLKQRLEPGDHTDSHSNGRKALPTSTFVELLTPQATSLCECSVELEGPRGKIRIQLKGPTMPDLAALSRAFLDCQR
jgi:hypothetical protein